MNMQTSRRKLLTVVSLLPLSHALIACNAAALGQRPMQVSSGDRFKNFGLALVVDAVPGAEILGVEFFADGSERRFYASSVTKKGNRAIMAFPGGKVPESVRVTWRDNGIGVNRPRQSGIYYDGPMLGDYTFPVASRIPDAVVEEINRNGGGLRLKFRLKPDGVLFGWDIERTPKEAAKYSREEIMARNMYFPPEYHLVGGDFLDTRY